MALFLFTKAILEGRPIDVFGNHSPVELMAFIGAIEEALGQKAQLNLLPMQPGDVAATYADVDDLVRDVGFSPTTPIQVGIGRFVEWYRQYYGR